MLPQALGWPTRSRDPFMLRKTLLTFCCVAAMTCTLACSNGPSSERRDQGDAVLFGPATMRLHPIFTTVKDWSGDGKPDGIEALVELLDQFGDPTKASGKIIFELYSFQKFDPNRKGPLLAEWVGDLSTLEAQRDRWNRTSRTYGFQLAYGPIQIDQNYLLTAEMQLDNGSRLFNTLVIQQQITPSKYNVPDFGLPPSATQPASPTTTPLEPGMRMPAP
ncbi:MAG: hypothetical protein JO353_03035 [Phycisphaerae bacterium]|nr:hypothetical protein [Phycisphaerae bacterium]